MDKGKKPGKSTALFKTNAIYMDLREIIREHALRYLPAKSLYRFNAVCRDWKLQISTPFFAHSQSFAFRSISGLFRQTLDKSISFISLDQISYGVPDPQLKFLPEPVNVLASSHGLLCCRGRFGDFPYYICNPVTQNWKKLPKPESEHGLEPAVVIAFEPSLLSFVSDYKLVCAFRSSDFEDAYEFEIYSSIENSWKTSPEVCFGENGRVLKPGGYYVNGVVYWLSNNYSIIGFDMKKNRVKVISSYEVFGFHSLGTMEGKICACRKRGSVLTISSLSNEFANTMHMEAKGKTWETKQIVLTNGVSSTSNNNMHDSDGIVFAIMKDVVVFSGGNKIFSHNLRNKETTKVESEVEFSRNDVYVPYVNSLVCV